MNRWNELVPSERTHAIVERLGRTFGRREGIGPDDHPLDAVHAGPGSRGGSRTRPGAEGLAEGEARGRAEMARQMLRSRGIEVSAGFPADLPAFHGSSEEAVVAAALACEDEGDFEVRLRRRPARNR